MNVIQIGANEGNDYLSTLLQDKAVNTLILIEPLKIYNDMLANQYLDLVEELYILNCAIVGEKKSDTMPLYYVEGHLENSSVIKKQITGYWNEIAISSTAVNVMTISEVMDFFELTHLDILFIDAEGCDAEIIASINFDKYDIDSIYFEHLTIDNQSNEKFLNSKGYVISKTDDYNTWVATKQ